MPIMRLRGQVESAWFNKNQSNNFSSSRNSCYSLVIADEYMYEATSADFWGYFSPKASREDLLVRLYSMWIKPVMLS